MSIKPVDAAKHVISNEKKSIAGLAAGFIVWWYFVGRKKYAPAKGTRKYV